jgi:hypothetical protein
MKILICDVPLQEQNVLEHWPRRLIFENCKLKHITLILAHGRLNKMDLTLYDSTPMQKGDDANF